MRSNRGLVNKNIVKYLTLLIILISLEIADSATIDFSNSSIPSENQEFNNESNFGTYFLKLNLDESLENS